VKRYRVDFSPEAASHVDAIAEWWAANRPAAPHLFREEIRAAIRQLSRSPHSGLPYESIGVRPTRRLLLPKSRHHLYYVPDDFQHVVRIYAVWHTARRERPQDRK
jgi:plasmid stabilization system protein ParE